MANPNPKINGAEFNNIHLYIYLTNGINLKIPWSRYPQLGLGYNQRCIFNSDRITFPDLSVELSVDTLIKDAQKYEICT